MTIVFPFHRWWIYQQERFPIFKHGLLIVVFSGAAVGYAARLSGQELSLITVATAFISTFCFFLQMRIADEFKDFEEDALYRPYRPVPRGLVSRKELGWIGVFSGGLQLGLALWLEPKLVGLLLGVWAYFGLMCKEFFVRPWLKARPVAYVLSHMVIVPLISLYAIACHALPVGSLDLTQLWPFLLTCFSNGLVIELGRKIRLPLAEEPGVETYSALWGLKPAIWLWMVTVGLSALLAGLAAAQIQALTIVIPSLTGLMGFIGWKVWRLFRQNSTCLDLPQASLPKKTLGEGNVEPLPSLAQGHQRRSAKDPLDIPTALWILGVYLGLGWLPVLLLH